MKRLWPSLGLLFVLAAPCGAQSAPSAGTDANAVLYPRHEAAASAAGSVATKGWSGGMTTFLVLVLGAAGGWMLWQRSRGASSLLGGRGNGGEKSLAIAETRSLGNRQFLVVASYGEKKFLLSVCPGRINLLTPLDPAARPPA